MTSARARADRIQNDAYHTPPDLAGVLVGLLTPWLKDGSEVVEPSVGGGAFVDAVRHHRPNRRVTGIDVDPDSPGLARCDVARVADWAAVAPEYKDRVDWVLGNPPYSHAEAHLAAALDTAPHVAMLLRLAFLEGGKRFRWWREHGERLRGVHVLAERPSFTGGTTDSAAYGWFIFGPTPSDGARLEVLSWREGAVRANLGRRVTAAYVAKGGP